MKLILAICAISLACIGCSANEPVVVRISWSTPDLTDEFIEAVNKHTVQVLTRGETTTVHAFGTIYYDRDLSHSRGWIARTDSGYVLCFNSPKALPAAGTALAAAASPAKFEYQIRDLPEHAALSFNENCETGR